MIDLHHIRHVGGVVHFPLGAVLHLHFVDNRRRGGDQRDIVFALKPLSNDLKVQEAQEAAPEAKAQRRRRLDFMRERRIIQRQFIDRRAQVFKLRRIDREDTAEHHRHRRLIARQRLLRPCPLGRDRVTDIGIADLLD